MNTPSWEARHPESYPERAGRNSLDQSYSYAGDSAPVSMNINGTEYYYLKNTQGDITHIVDGDGNGVASCGNDAWGNHLEAVGGEIAELNPSINDNHS